MLSPLFLIELPGHLGFEFRRFLRAPVRLVLRQGVPPILQTEQQQEECLCLN